MAATDAKPVPIKNQAYRVSFPIYDADGDLITGAAALDSEVSLDGAAFADCTSEATEIATSSGVYYLDLTAAEMNADTVAVIVKTTTAGAKTTTLILYPAEDGDIPVNVKQVNGTAQTAGDIIGDTNDIQTRLPAALSGGKMDSTIGTGSTLTAVPWNAAWDAEVQSECDDAIVSRNLHLIVLATGNCTVGGTFTTTSIDAQNLSPQGAVAGFYKDCVLRFTSGALSGCARKISSDTDNGLGAHTFGFTGSGHALPAAPAGGDTFVILGVVDEAMRGTNSAALASSYTAARAGYLDNLNVGGAVATAASVWANATRTLTTLGSGVVAEIWDALTSGMIVAGSIGKRIVDYLTGDIFARIGAPAGASVSADIAAVKTDTGTIVTNVAAILDDTGTSGVVLTAAERTSIADALLKRDLSLVTGEAARSPLNALRTLRNKVTIIGTTLTVYKEDDTTVAYTATITTDAAALPITASDPV